MDKICPFFHGKYTIICPFFQDFCAFFCPFFQDLTLLLSEYNWRINKRDTQKAGPKSFILVSPLETLSFNNRNSLFLYKKLRVSIIETKSTLLASSGGITNPPVLIGRTFFYGGFQIRRDA